ncbi:MAG: hypothetical protein OER82_01275 [Nitrosopumilus sp.]|nr:hypothetical protein [Nitrosopumilus sp.]
MLLTPSGRESFDHHTGRDNNIAIGWDLSIHGCIQLGLKVDLPGNIIGSQLTDAPEINYAMGSF